MIEEAGLGEHERSNARRAHGRTQTGPLPKHHRGLADIGPRKRALQRVAHLKADRRHYDAIRSPLWHRPDGYRPSLRCLDILADPDDCHIEPG